MCGIAALNDNPTGTALVIEFHLNKRPVIKPALGCPREIGRLHELCQGRAVMPDSGWQGGKNFQQYRPRPDEIIQWFGGANEISTD